jgi:hypothetical protein
VSQDGQKAGKVWAIVCVLASAASKASKAEDTQSEDDATKLNQILKDAAAEGKNGKSKDAKKDVLTTAIAFLSKTPTAAALDLVRKVLGSQRSEVINGFLSRAGRFLKYFKHEDFYELTSEDTPEARLADKTMVRNFFLARLSGDRRTDVVPMVDRVFASSELVKNQGKRIASDMTFTAPNGHLWYVGLSVTKSAPDSPEYTVKLCAQDAGFEVEADIMITTISKSDFLRSKSWVELRQLPAAISTDHMMAFAALVASGRRMIDAHMELPAPGDEAVEF